MALRDVVTWRFIKCSPYPYLMFRLISPKNVTLLTNNTSPQAFKLQYRLVIEVGTLMIPKDIEGVCRLVPFTLRTRIWGAHMWLAWVRCSVVPGEYWMRPLWAMRSILSLPGISMICCRSLASVTDLRPRRVKISFYPSTFCTSTSSWRGAVAGDILGDAVLNITVPQRDVSLVGS